ncbi:MULTISPECIES: Ni/Fe hydrogenase subunit alpha [Methanoculleus]|jgi:F420-non-reducing hydrogenase large subunit|uniref:F420-non-reducing hydrogenase large subunit n=1 Tax=Methanoculleus thermophilus TaxID=2200 RepID=A0A1G8YII4_9EURY|nr:MULTISPECIES: Ni/Fe hydrogenase subunit alpha [Methanoculleus]NLN08347.1 Ni/Fe hydrogenase subunit alpha [Methanoculleus thermophilus]SDK02561.1 F420-non-reducing hydrogenase large subunit [Methanoculleus thermophilus]HQD26012.1 Ni/Fe hydrogenase subunit alpha [Methanoculleus thermophilus]
MKEITISPVTRIEGHAGVKIFLNDQGEVDSAHFQVVELRGFEKFLIGAAIEEAPRITPRICGICPSAHHLAAAKATDQIFGVEPPATGKKLRELLNIGQFVHSHALHFFMLAAPDFILGYDAPVESRNVIGLARQSPELAKKAIAVRKFGQRLTEGVGGKPIHPANAIPGGMSAPLTEGKRAELAGMAKEALEIALEGWDIARTLLDGVDTEIGAVRTGFMGMSKHGLHSTYEGPVAMLGPDGGRIGSFFGEEYPNFIEEYSEDWSYLKFARFKGGDYYRVGPLARLNIVERMGTEHADAALKEYRERFGAVTQAALAYHLARYIEFVASCERAVELLSDPGITASDTRTPVGGVVNRRGVGIIEAPRGTLIHDYTVNEAGIIERCNLIVATCQNNYAIDRGVEDMARRVVENGALTEGAANRIEMIIRAYDPCISCATHAIGRMPLRIECVRRT